MEGQGHGEAGERLKKLNFFLCRKATEYYTVVVEGEREEAYANLAEFFPEVRYVKDEALDAADRTRYMGDRPLGNCTIRGCYFSCDFIPSQTNIHAAADERYEYDIQNEDEEDCLRVA